MAQTLLGVDDTSVRSDMVGGVAGRAFVPHRFRDSRPASGVGQLVAMSGTAAEALLRLTDKGDALSMALAQAIASGDLAAEASVRDQIEDVERRIVKARAGLARPHELGALRSRAHESERDLDALLDELAKDEAWAEVVRLTEREIERLDDMLRLRREKKQRIDPWIRQRMRTIADLHNKALDASRRTG